MVSRAGRYRVYVGVLALLAVQVQKGHAHNVKCYSCSSKVHEGCLKPDTDEYVPVVCGMSMLRQMQTNAENISHDYSRVFDVDGAGLKGDFICLKLDIQDGNKRYVLRGCQLGLQGELDICRKVKEQDRGFIRMVNCSKCNTDSCNFSMGSPRLSTALLSLLCLAAMFRL